MGGSTNTTAQPSWDRGDRGFLGEGRAQFASPKCALTTAPFIYCGEMFSSISPEPEVIHTIEIHIIKIKMLFNLPFTG